MGAAGLLALSLVLAQSSPARAAVRFCAFSGGQPAEQGALAALSLELPAGLAASADSPVPVSAAGVLHPEAAVRARALLREMLAQAPASIPEALRRRRIYLAVIPMDKKLTDLPEFASLRGVPLPDGRVWDDVRGVGFVSQDDGAVAVAAGEENFLAGAQPDRYPKGFLVAHEFSHAVHGFGLSPEESARVLQAYRDRESARLEFPSSYASTNELEYFAVSASSFFGRTLSGRDPERDIGWIRDHDPVMFALLGRAYGTPRPLWSGFSGPDPARAW